MAAGHLGIVHRSFGPGELRALILSAGSRPEGRAASGCSPTPLSDLPEPEAMARTDDPGGGRGDPRALPASRPSPARSSGAKGPNRRRARRAEETTRATVQPASPGTGSPSRPARGSRQEAGPDQSPSRAQTGTTRRPRSLADLASSAWDGPRVATPNSRPNKTVPSRRPRSRGVAAVRAGTAADQPEHHGVRRSWTRRHVPGRPHNPSVVGSIPTGPTVGTDCRGSRRSKPGGSAMLGRPERAAKAGAQQRRGSVGSGTGSGDRGASSAVAVAVAATSQELS